MAQQTTHLPLPNQLPAVSPIPEFELVPDRPGDDDRFAAVLTLDYDVQDRMEHSVVFFCSNWEELVPLLTDPYQYMLDRQNEFEPNVAERKLCWQLRPPVTAILRPGKDQIRSRNQYASFIEYKAFLESRPIEGNPSFNSFLDGNEAPRPSAASRVASSVQAGGAFYVEFAVDTNILNVFYWLPNTIPAVRRYRGTFTPGVLAVTPGQQNKRTGALHFDLKVGENDERPTNLQRALFIVDCLESRERIASDLRLLGLIKFSHAELTRPNAGMVVRTEPQGALDINGIEAPPTREDFPMIVIDNLSTLTDPCFACCNVPVAEVLKGGRSVYIMEDMEIKCYNKPQPCPPEPRPRPEGE